MKILLNNHSLNKTLRPFNDIGFVPTMGGIHEGHISLIRKSIKYTKKTIVSIFVNPKQFNNKNDYKTYPLNIKKDLNKIKKIHKVDFIYIPKFKDIYKNKSKPKIMVVPAITNAVRAFSSIQPFIKKPIITAGIVATITYQASLLSVDCCLLNPCVTQATVI